MKTASVVLAAIFFSSSALAGPISDQAGLDLCKREMTSSIGDGLVLDRDQLIQRKDNERTYFLNGMRWQNGSRSPVGVACTTATNGQRILSFESIDGRFVVRDVDSPTELVSATK